MPRACRRSAPLCGRCLSGRHGPPLPRHRRRRVSSAATWSPPCWIAATRWSCWTISAPAIAPRCCPARGSSSAIWTMRRASMRCSAEGPWDRGVAFRRAIAGGREHARAVCAIFVRTAATALRLIDACVRHGVQRFVLSSTAALFGAPAGAPIAEDAADRARLALWREQVDAGTRTAGWAEPRARTAQRQPALFQRRRRRSCGPAGRGPRAGDPSDPAGDRRGARPAAELAVFGDDYPTPRRHLHARLRACQRSRGCASARARPARAGQRALQSRHRPRPLRAGGDPRVERVGGRRVPRRHRRAPAGDPPVLVASSARIVRETGWQPRFTDLDGIVGTALAWREAHPHGYRTPSP